MRALPASSDSRVDWVAVLLEMLPFAAVLLLFAAIQANSPAVLMVTIGVSLLSGGGWWRIGRPKAGIIIALGRGIVFVYALSFGVTEEIKAVSVPVDGATADGSGQSVIDAALMFFLLSTLASATVVGAVSRFVPASTPASGPAGSPESARG